MFKPVIRHLATAAPFAALFAIAVAAAGRPQSDPAVAAKVDQVFARWNERTPGCAVGVSVNGRSVLERGYGMADLEHDVRNTGETIFEAGSVSKQFTAAAVLLLARDGKLSLDDPVRKHVPELPDYGAPLTIRHMLNHTSGLRDWGNIASISGWPRTTRIHTHSHVLDIVSRQRALNFPSGTRYSYSNTGYNLATIIVARASGEPFADFSRKRIFEPLGMSKTSWRDDYTRIVKGRAIAYADARDGFRLDMPFENVHGNGGLLTTVGDMLRWTEHFAEPKLGDASFVREQQQPGRFNDGRQHDYALGLRIAQYKSVREVGHSGSTAGYRAYLADYPDQRVSVGVLCNVSSGNASQYAHAVADLYLGSAITSPAPQETTARYELKPGEVDAAAGLYRSTETGEPLRILKGASGLRLEGGAQLQAESGTRFTTTNRRSVEIAGGRLRLIDQFGSAEPFERVADNDVQPRQLTDYTGTYVSDEAEVSYTAVILDGALALKRRPDTTIRLTPLYADAFRGGLGFIRFHRDGAGKVTDLSVSQDRVWDLRFARQ